MNANNCWYFNIYEHDEFHECFKIDIVVLMDVNMPTIVGFLTFMSMTSFMNVLRLILSRMR